MEQGLREDNVAARSSYPERETPVAEDDGIPKPYKFTGTITEVTVEVNEMTSSSKTPKAKAAADTNVKNALSD